jgi:hypothetical protein
MCRNLYQDPALVTSQRIPATEISRLADDLIANFGPQAADIAALEQDRAVHNSDPFEQGKWWRVEREIKRRRLSPRRNNRHR